MEQDLEKRLAELEKKVDRIWRSVEQTRKMYLWSLIIGAVLFVLPLIGLAFAFPTYLKSLDISSLVK